jgi:hypothetical protein
MRLPYFISFFLIDKVQQSGIFDAKIFRQLAFNLLVISSIHLEEASKDDSDAEAAPPRGFSDDGLNARIYCDCKRHDAQHKADISLNSVRIHSVIEC